MRFVHVATRTADLDRAVRFYELLGMRVDHRRELERGRATLVYLAPLEDNFSIELVYNWGRDEPYEGGERFGHFAFEVEGLDELFPQLIEAGAESLRPPYLLEGKGPKIAFVADPDGNRIELIER